jgi:spore germination protein PA
MPAIVGTVGINTVSGVFNIGDAGTIAPSNFSKTFAGGGSFNSGDNMRVFNESSVINVYDADPYDRFIQVPKVIAPREGISG